MEPHEADQFRNAATLTVAITFTVAGGARVDTARRRGERLAARLADSATRVADTVEVSACTHRGGVQLGDGHHALLFPAANTELNVGGATGRRWIDPEHELGQRSLAAADATARAAHEADLERRRDVGCRNGSRLLPDWSCRCVYCRPVDHPEAATIHLQDMDAPTPLCPCGRLTRRAGPCRDHEHVQVVVLDHDPPELLRVVDLEGRDHGLELP